MNTFFSFVSLFRFEQNPSFERHTMDNALIILNGPRLH